MRRSSPDRSPITKLAATRAQDTDATVIGMARDGFDTSQILDLHIPFAWNSEDKVFEVEIQCRWIRTGYTFLHRWSRLLAIGTILISLFANLSPALTGIAIGLDVVTLGLLFVSIVRVVRDEGSVSGAEATSVPAEETAEYSDETADERE